MLEGNCLAQLKFNLINDWVLPQSSQSLHGFVGLCGFYTKFCPWFEIEAAPLQCLIRRFKYRAILPEEWTPELWDLFRWMKEAVTSSLVLARYNALKPCFAKTDWLALGIGYILMQPDDSSESETALQWLRQGKGCNFDTPLKGACLKPVRFGARNCKE